MTRILLSLISALSVLFAFGARPVVNQELRHVGEVLWQQPCTAEFTLTNKDKTPLRIASMHVSCGCLQAKASSDIIPSGGSATIRLTYDALQMGTFHKEVAVRFEGNDTPLWLAMEGRVVRERLVVDTLLPVNFGNVRLSTANIEFEHVNRGDRPRFCAAASAVSYASPSTASNCPTTASTRPPFISRAITVSA